MPIHQDASEWPLVIDVGVDEGTDDDVRAYIMGHRRYLARRQLYAAVFDARLARYMTGAQRQLVAEWIREQRDELKRYHAALALVTSSTLAKGFMEAIYWMQPPPYPHAVFTDLNEAKAWARKQIAIRAAEPVSSSQRPPESSRK